MNYATIEEVRLHLNLETDDIDTDMTTRLTMYMQTALAYIQIKVNAIIVESDSDIPSEDDDDYNADDVYIVFNQLMKQCELMLVEEFFKNRGTSSNSISRPVAVTVDNILNKQRYFNV